MNLKEKYINKANYIMEAPEDDVEDSSGDVPVDKIEIYFDNLDENSQQVFLKALRGSLKVTDDDQYGNRKIMEALAKKPLFTLMTEELVRLMNIDI